VQYGTAFVFLLLVGLIATSSILLRNKLRGRYQW
jgi:phosphate transport system permease protein